jgi:5-methylcytosine-specific restriction protein A
MMRIRLRRQAAEARQKRMGSALPRKRGQKPDPNREPKRGDRRWGELRAAQLQREPFCRECARAGNRTPATEVDHVVAIVDGGSFDDPSNHQSLCGLCHWRKTANENARRAGRRPRKVRARAVVDLATGWAE